MSKFKHFSLNEALISRLDDLGIHDPTEIQRKAIPEVLQGKDILGIAQTGTGKTFAFLLPLMELKRKTLILVPTRELALQVHTTLEKLGNTTSVAVFGGVEQDKQVAGLRARPDFIIATPGRLLDLIEQKQVPLKTIETLVLDEADQMLDLGFIDDITLITKQLNQVKQTLFFSATIPSEVLSLSDKLLKSPVRVEVTKNSSTVAKIEQKVIFCKREDKFQLLRKKLKEDSGLTVVFTKTKVSADKVKEYLRHYRMASIVLHGDKSQSEREKALLLFRDGSMRILIATDIAARGIDVPGISLVINFEMPLDPLNYVHRIGRTGRAGKEGLAISFCDESERSVLEKIQEIIKLKLPYENYKGTPEPKGVWSDNAPVVVPKKAPTPGVSQEKRGFIDHSKRQGDRPVAKSHPGFRGKKKKR